jgi:hypothetical protein
MGPRRLPRRIVKRPKLAPRGTRWYGSAWMEIGHFHKQLKTQQQHDERDQGFEVTRRRGLILMLARSLYVEFRTQPHAE